MIHWITQLRQLLTFGQTDGIKDERNKATYMVIRPFFSFKHVELCKQIEKLLTILVLKK
jgi:hypothetical protein